MHLREELAHELLLGTPGPKGRTTYLKPNSKREILARKSLARLMRQEAPRGYYTQLVAAHIYPPASLFIKRRIVFQPLVGRGAPVVVTDRRRIAIAAFMHDQLRRQKRQGARTDAQARNLKHAIAAAEKKFGKRRSTIMKIWSFFQPIVRQPAPRKSARSGRPGGKSN